MDTKAKLAAISALVYQTAEDKTSEVSPSMSRHQKERLKLAVSSYYTALEELNHVFQDINSTHALSYFGPTDATLIRQAATSLSDARRAIRRLASVSDWIRKSKP